MLSKRRPVPASSSKYPRGRRKYFQVRVPEKFFALADNIWNWKVRRGQSRTTPLEFLSIPSKIPLVLPSGPRASSFVGGWGPSCTKAL
jgi:hypothetical protein